MRQYIFPFEKIVLFLFYLESMIIMQAEHKQYFWMAIALVSIVSYIYEGARPYTPVFFIVAVADYFDLQTIQIIGIVILGLLVVYLKFYHIQIVGKGPYNSGYKYIKEKDYEIAIFYPSMADGKHAKWIPSQSYRSALYDIAYNNPFSWRLPYRIFSFILSFLFKVKMPVLGDASLYVNDFDKDQTWKLVVFSHGLGSNLNNYSALCGWWASHGYIVVSIQHNHDVIRIEFPKQLLKELTVLERRLYKSRNHDLTIRAKQTEIVLNQILQKDLLNIIFKPNKPIIIKQIYLAGHSFGAATVLETMANLIQKKEVTPLIKGLICLDTWFFPLSQLAYSNLKDQNILLINSQSFFSILPFIYQMENKLNRIKQNNHQTMKPFVITKTDHLSISDFVFTFGNFFKLSKTVKLQEQAKPIIELHEIIISLFMGGQSKQKIMEVSNSYVNKLGLQKKGVQVVEEWRYQRTDKRDSLQ